jgi:D-psicose/D-tagatose/L-ribulose 3-epimerase
MSIKVSMHNWMRPEPIAHTIKRLARLGYDGLEISGEPQAFDVAAVRAMLDEHGLECWGAVTLMTAGRDLLDQDPYVRRGSVQYVKDCLTFVSELGGRIVTVVPSTVGKTVPMASPSEEWHWAVESLKRCQEHAESVGVRIALEPLNRFETNFLNRHDQALLLAEEVGPDVGVCLDVYHMNQEEADMLQAFRNAGDKLYDVHVADNNRMACGQGQLDWAGILGTLNDIGYEGSVTVEFVPPLDRTPANPYKNAVAAADDTLTPEQLKFIEDHGSGVLSEAFYSWLVEESIKTLRAHL